jgi:hypothetical protein
MHSQLMFNECIARGIKNDVHISTSTIFQCVIDQIRSIDSVSMS